MKKIRVIIFTLLMVILVEAKFQKTALLTQNPEQYRKVEMNIYLEADWQNPYDAADISLDMIAISPSDNEQTVPCFFESGKSGEKSIWKVRFMPAEAGKYSYYFLLKQKDNKTIQTKKRKFSVRPSDAKGILHVNNHWTLRYDNGDLFRGIGENICWESRDNDDSRYFRELHEDKRFNYEYMVRKLAANGGNFFRTWMIYWNLPVDWKNLRNNSRYTDSESLYNPSAMKKMDRLVELCDSLEVHVMVALESHVGYMGEGWDISPYNLKNGGTAKTPTEFFTLESAKKQYKNKLRLMVARYGYSPAIGMWEFFNEIDNVMYHGKQEEHIPDEIITRWHDEMSSYLKEIDPYDHIVTTSVSHREVAGLWNLKNMDINQKHIYKYTGAIPEILQESSKKYNKPFIIGEFGYEWDWSQNFNDFADEMDSDFKRGLWYGLFNPTPVLPMSWWWEFFENRGMMAYFQNVRKISDEMIKSGKGDFEQIAIQSKHDNQKVFGVQCGGKIYIYVYNRNEFKGPVGLDFDDKISFAEIQYYNCETGEYHQIYDAKLSNKSLTFDKLNIPGKSDIILILSLDK
ncbi:MAG: DUF5060 domain-containing protein [Candidatus Marinimicrobia bacterium]|nr:DUF5060 domain-containing protein [Candidatus Neomarinimicrobiota bacterium]